MPSYKVPGVGTVVMVGTQEQADRMQAIVNARHKFCLNYMEEKGWGQEMIALSLDQIMEIRDQEGWKNPIV